MDKKEELLTLTPGDGADGRNESDDDNDGWEPVVPIKSPCDSFRGTEGLAEVGQVTLKVTAMKH
jgi:hypothetical protein